MKVRRCWCSVPAQVAGALGLNPFRPQIFDIPEKHLENERKKVPQLEKRGIHSAKSERVWRFDSCSAISWENSHPMQLIWNVIWALSVNLPNSKFTVLFHECFIKKIHKGYLMYFVVICLFLWKMSPWNSSCFHNAGWSQNQISSKRNEDKAHKTTNTAHHLIIATQITLLSSYSKLLHMWVRLPCVIGLSLLPFHFSTKFSHNNWNCILRIWENESTFQSRQSFWTSQSDCMNALKQEKLCWWAELDMTEY